MNEKCFALRKGCVCSALEGKNCAGYLHCPFYRPVWQQQQRQKKADMRLERLPAAVQEEIATKYYYGKMPWKEELV